MCLSDEDAAGAGAGGKCSGLQGTLGAPPSTEATPRPVVTKASGKF